MNYEPLSLAHQPFLDQALEPLGLGISDTNFVNLWLWRHSRQIEVATLGGFVLVRLVYPHRPPVLLMPLGKGDLAGCLEEIRVDFEARGEHMSFRAISDQMRKQLETIWPERFEFAHTPCHDDYLYDTQALIELKGRAYHSKKNFVNRFVAEYGLDFGPMQSGDVDSVLDFLQGWFARAPYASDAEREGIEDIVRAHKHFSACRYGVLRAEDSIVGLSVSEALSADMVGIHVEKANSDYRGAYQVLNQVNLAHFWPHMKLVNREEDLGIEGLKKAKLSYRPVGFVTKYNATLRG